MTADHFVAFQADPKRVMVFSIKWFTLLWKPTQFISCEIIKNWFLWEL